MSAPLWTELKKAALIGTETIPPPAATAEGALGEVLAATEGTPEQRLWSAIAAAGLWQEAGALPPPADGRLEADEAPAETRPILPTRILNEYYWQAGGYADEKAATLKMILSAAAERGYALPTKGLPGLLEEARKRQELRPLLAAVLPEEGRWLARQNPAWAPILAQANAQGLQPEVWESGKKQERLDYLKALRAKAPAEGRSLLEKAWASEPGNLRRDLLEAFLEGLSPEDEPFLETALDDKSKAVRHLAAFLLARLPDSEFARRMAQRAEAWMRVLEKDGGPSLEFEIPDKLDKAARRDGLEPDMRDFQFFQGKTAMVAVAVGATPLQFWEEAGILTPGDYLGPLEGTHFREGVLAGLVRAAGLQANLAWARALIAMEAPQEFNRVFFGFFQVLPSELRDDLLAQMLASGNEGGLAMLGTLEPPWSEGLTRAAASTIGSMCNKEGRDKKDMSPFFSANALSMHGHPSFFPEFEKQMSVDLRTIGATQENVSRLIEKYRLRYQLHQEIAKL